MVALEILTLDHNLITDTGMFNGNLSKLICLKKLNLSYNDINNLKNNLFGKLLLLKENQKPEIFFFFH